MKTLLFSLTLIGLALTSTAAEKKDFDDLLQKITFKFESMMNKPDKRIPAEQLSKAHGIILLDRSKAGFLFAYSGGGGVAMLKDPKSQKWSPAALMKANEASIGFQVGKQQSFMVILLMNTNATAGLFNPKISFAGEASGTADNKTKGTEANISAAEPGVLIYDERQGLYGGAAIKGGAIAYDEEGNHTYYGEYLTLKDILIDKKPKPTERVTTLTQKIVEFSKKK